MLAHTRRATVTVRVPRGAAGDVEGGVRAVLSDVDGVERVDDLELCGVRPDALDLYVDVRATVAVEGATPEEFADRLCAGFGVVDARVATPDAGRDE